jgi:hypothetical protein
MDTPANINGFVYKWVDSSNSMYYIGSHQGEVSDKYVGGGIHFKRAYKLRKDCFSREILYLGPDFREVEELILETLDCQNDKFSYNLKNAAVGGNMGLEGIKKMRSKLIGVPKSESMKEKMRNRVISKETRIKKSKSLTRYSVYCGTNGKTYFNIKEASLDLGFSSPYLREMINGKKTNKFQLQKIDKL